MSLFFNPNLKELTKKLLLPLLLLLLTAYFVYHLLEGRYGIRSWQLLKVRHQELSVEVREQEEKTSALNDKVARLRPDSLDLDYVEELVHDKIGAYHKDDIVVHMAR